MAQGLGSPKDVLFDYHSRGTIWRLNEETLEAVLMPAAVNKTLKPTP